MQSFPDKIKKTAQWVLAIQVELLPVLLEYGILNGNVLQR